MSSTKSLTNDTFPNFLCLLFFVEMWERFSYYGMRALLVLFLTSYIGVTDKKAYVIYSLFAAISYAVPIIGGYLADRVMGFRKMVIIGALVMTFGHTALALSGTDLCAIFLGLSLIGVGTGLFKGNITNLLGECYRHKEEDRSTGFGLFYVGVNVGSFLASISCAIVAHQYGWHYGFGLAGFGMLLGLITFIKFQYVLGDTGRSPINSTKLMNIMQFSGVIIFSIILSIICTVSFENSELFVNVLQYFGFALLIIFGYITYKTDERYRENMYIIAIMTIFLMLFFALEMQLGSLINLFTERNVTNSILEIQIPAAISQAINPISVILFGLLFNTFFKLRKSLDTFRMLLGILAIAACFFILYFGCINADTTSRVHYVYLIVSISIMGLGEIFIAPVVQSYVSLLAPQKYKGLIMGIMLLSLAFSNLGGVVIAEFMSIPHDNGISTAYKSLQIYKKGFWDIAIFNLYIAIAFIPFGLYIHRKLSKRNSTNESDTNDHSVSTH
ncbi:Putative MFS transporter [Candidatus Fokinia solitaria]|uniref:MFS transporter n=1 Tax=Candidatus Fokinia solitaria TaxID=1802984 RepID=A0A2U8BT32_9RICK|nr:peptide MFS transporter [Candidatus Fokinia solitaria]AWD33502.1 Putative MFS transporter [Candidatus Fokinia solitaria]